MRWVKTMSKKRPEQKSPPIVLPKEATPTKLHHHIQKARAEGQDRATLAEISERISFIIKEAMRGQAKSDIMQAIAKKYEISERMCNEMYSRAMKQIVEDNRQSTAESAGILIRKFWEIAEEAKSVGEYAPAISSLKEVSRLKGLDQQIVNHIHHEAKEAQEVDFDIIDAEFSEDE